MMYVIFVKDKNVVERKLWIKGYCLDINWKRIIIVDGKLISFIIISFILDIIRI